MRLAMSSESLRAAASRALETVVDPCSIATGIPISLADMGMLQNVSVEGNHVVVTLALTSPICWQVGNIIEAVEKSVSAVPGVESARCAVDHEADWLPSAMAESARLRLRRLRPVDHPVTVES
jgi:metal-sulfur cluster biosynthetic enzyme